MNSPPTFVYLSFAFSNDPTGNTKKAREMTIALIKKHPDWLVFCPHYSIDAMLDGKVDWTGMKEKDFGEWRRTQAGLMAAGFLSRADIIVLGCNPTYGASSGVTWEYIIAKLLNISWRQDNQIKIMTYGDAMK